MTLLESLPAFDAIDWVLHGSIFTVNIVLLIFAKQITKFFASTKDPVVQTSLFRALNVLFMIFHIIDIFLLNAHEMYNSFFFKLGWTLALIYFSMLFYSFLALLSRKKFGKVKVFDDKEVRIDSYNSRLVDIFLVGFMIIFSFYCLIQIWNLDSLLETTGLFGILIGFMALTNQIWAPDLFYGMVILNSKLLEDGDVIQVNHEPHEYIIQKVTFIYTVLIDVRNNHRTMLRNSKLIEQRIDNLSKKASAEGVRYAIKYNIGYPPIVQEPDRAKREELYNDFVGRIHAMFEAVYAEMKRRDDVIKVNGQIPMEWWLTETADYALVYTLYYSLETIPNTKIAKTIRSYLVTSRNALNEEVYKQSVLFGVELATPMLISQKV